MSNNEKDDFYDDKIYTLEDVSKALEEADKRDGITDENRNEMFEKSVKEFIDKFSLFCAYPDKVCKGLEEEVKEKEKREKRKE